MINAGTPEFEVEVHRNPDPQPKFALLDEMLFERGTKEDWDALHELHYKATNATGGHYYRVSLHGELIGVCVMTSPRGLLGPRHKLFPRIRIGTNGSIIIPHLTPGQWSTLCIAALASHTDC